MGGAQLQRVGEREIEGGLSALDVSPCGAFCLAGSPLGELVLLDANGAVLWRAGMRDRIIGACCARDREYSVAITSERMLAVFDADGSKLWDKKLRHEAGCIDIRHASHLIAIGNRFHYLRQLSIHGKHLERVEASHPVDFVRFSPKGANCVIGAEDGTITLLTSNGKPIWTRRLQRTITGLDLSHGSGRIIAPTANEGVFAIESDGMRAGVFHTNATLVAAEIDDRYGMLFQLTDTGLLLLCDTETGLMKQCDTGMRGDRLCVDGEGTFIAVGASDGRVALFKRSDKAAEREDFVEAQFDPREIRRNEDDETAGYIDI